MLGSTKNIRALITCTGLAVLAVTGCSRDSSLPTENQMAGFSLAQASQASSAQTLNDLRKLTAAYHDLDAATSAGYSLLVIPGNTTADGCISDMNAGGMGYHYSRFDNLGDNTIDLLNPEFFVYAPNKAPVHDGVQGRKLAAFEYFIPYGGNVWPGPNESGFVRAPRTSDFPSFDGLPDVALAAANRFGGWAIHIWLWENNPDGMLMNWNKSVPLCDGSIY